MCPPPERELQVVRGDHEKRRAGDSGTDQGQLQQVIDQRGSPPTGDHVQQQGADGAEEIDRAHHSESDVTRTRPNLNVM